MYVVCVWERVSGKEWVCVAVCGKVLVWVGVGVWGVVIIIIIIILIIFPHRKKSYFRGVLVNRSPICILLDSPRF